MDRRITIESNISNLWKNLLACKQRLHQQKMVDLLIRIQLYQARARYTMNSYIFLIYFRNIVMYLLIMHFLTGPTSMYKDLGDCYYACHSLAMQLFRMKNGWSNILQMGWYTLITSTILYTTVSFFYVTEHNKETLTWL